MGKEKSRRTLRNYGSYLFLFSFEISQSPLRVTLRGENCPRLRKYSIVIRKAGTNHKVKIKKLIRVGGVVTIVTLAVGSIYLNTKKNAYRNEDVTLEKFGVIENVKVSEARNTPYFLIDGEWIYLGYFGSSIIDDVIINDSISKSKDQDVLFLYRKNKSKDYSLIKKVGLR